VLIFIVKKYFSLSILIIFFLSPVHAQGSDSTETDEMSMSAKAALYGMTGVFVPLAVAGVAVSFFPPAFGILQRDGTSYATLGIESGVGFGEWKETGVFSDYRFTLGYTHVYKSNVRDLFRVEAKKDFNFDFIDRRKIFLSGFHISAGVLSDFPNHGYTVGAGAWLKTPWLAFFGFFPSHTFGITYRYNSFFAGKSFYEISAGVTSIITF
jgi:hypothetical protein